MRTNIVLDEQLLLEAIYLSGVKTRKEVVHIALQRLVNTLRKQPVKREQFIRQYIHQPVELDAFTPLSREEVYVRMIC